MMKRNMVFVFVVISLCVTNSVFAKTLVDATIPEDIVSIAKGFGSATLDKDSTGDPKIVGMIDGSRYTILFYGCVNGKDCDDIQFTVGWSGINTSLEDINNWNRKKRFGKAILDSDNDPVLLMDVDIDHGVSKRNLEESFALWTRVMNRFKIEVLKK